MKNKKKYIIYIIWLLGVFIWNFLYPEVPPIYDVIMAILLSIMTIILNKLNLF
tara:strand:+ start:375 stop:533 length:159 start_codon:yes stop_codon:yes gene_type:complete